MRHLANIMLLLLVLTVAVLLSACAGDKGEAGEQGLQGLPGAPAATPVPTPTPEVDAVLEDVRALIDAENEYRITVGQALLSEGLSCALQTFTSGDRIQASISGHNTLSGLANVGAYTFRGSFNQPESPSSDGMNVLPPALRSLYTNLYYLRCTGSIVIRESGYINFELNSDDASLLFIDGAKVIDNDNGHAPTTVSGQKLLRHGVHTIDLRYAQSGGGLQSLILKSGGPVLDPKLLFH